MQRGMAGATGTELMFSDVLKLTGVVNVFGEKKRMNLRNPINIYMYSLCIAPTNSTPFMEVPTRPDVKNVIINNPEMKKMQGDCQGIIRLLQYGEYQHNSVDLFMMYLLPLFEDIAGWIPSDTSRGCFEDPSTVMTNKPRFHIKRDIICGVRCVNDAHFVPYIVLFEKGVILYLDPMGIRHPMDEKTKLGLSKIIRDIKTIHSGYDDVAFYILELDFPKHDFYQDGGNSCMDWSCVIFYVFLKYFHGCISRGETPYVPISEDGKSYDFQKISGDIFVSKDGLLSFQRGILNLTLKTLEFNEFLDNNGVDIGSMDQIQQFMSLSNSKQEDRMRDNFSLKYSHSDSVWKYVLVGDCGIPREILGACAELTKDKLKVDEMSKTITTSKLTMLMAAIHYKQKHNVLLQLFNAIPDQTNTKPLSDRTALRVNTFPYTEATGS
jgi:hypothetical protein